MIKLESLSDDLANLASELRVLVQTSNDVASLSEYLSTDDFWKRLILPGRKSVTEAVIMLKASKAVLLRLHALHPVVTALDQEASLLRD